MTNATAKQSGVIINVHVIPNSHSFEIARKDRWTDSLKVRVKSEATKGRANKELVQELGRSLGTKVEIISGHTSHKKRVLILDKSKDEVSRWISSRP